MTATVCPTCLGDGSVLVPRAALLKSGNQIRSAASNEPCKTCKGVGYLPGIKPPV